jgi:predicted acyltransferase (DUF342 family)
LIGSESRVQALAAEGDVELREKVNVARWLDGNGQLTIGAGCRVGARVTSRKGIRLGLGAEIISGTAPEIGTAGWDGKPGVEVAPEKTLFELDFVEDLSAVESNLTIAGLKKDRLMPLGADTWLYRGSIAPTVAVRLKKKLVVQGDCQFAPGSVLEADVKAGGSLLLGPACISQGNLVADGDIFLGQGCGFGGLIHSGKSLLLSRGSRGYRAGSQVAVYAEQDLNLETDVAVAGKIASGQKVGVINAADASEWKERRGIGEEIVRGASA